MRIKYTPIMLSISICFQLGFTNTSKEINDTAEWMNTKLEEINSSKYESIETRMTELKV